MGKQRNILTIDDELTVRQLIKSVLELDGYRVHESENGVEGLRAAREIRPDIILLDVDMPEMNGHEVVQRLKADEDLRTIPVIMLTRHRKRSDKIEGLDLGADEYLTKPVYGSELTARVNALLRTVDLQNEVFRLEREHQELQMQIAKEVQQELLPSGNPSEQGLEISIEYQTCDKVGGDFYDFAQLSDQSLMLTFGDAEGHGIGASLLMARAGAYVRAGIETGLREPAKMLDWVNRLMCSDHGSSALLPIISLSFSPSSSQLSYANAGHLPALLMRAASIEILPLKSTAPLLGIDADERYEQAAAAFEPAIPGDGYGAVGLGEAGHRALASHPHRDVLKRVEHERRIRPDEDICPVIREVFGRRVRPAFGVRVLPGPVLRRANVRLGPTVSDRDAVLAVIGDEGKAFIVVRVIAARAD